MTPVPIVLPVRFSGGGLSMQTTSSRLSAEGIFVRCLVSPKEGAQITLEISFPSLSSPVAVSGVITERSVSGGQGKEAGFFVTFGELSKDAREQFSSLLQARGEKGIVDPSAPQPAPVAAAAPPRPRPAMEPNRRSYARVLTRLQVGWSSPREFLVAYSENISRGGIFVVTANPPALREIVELLLELPDGQGPARTQAEVVQRTTADEAKASGRVAGAGLQFVGADDEFRARLDACIENLLVS